MGGQTDGRCQTHRKISREIIVPHFIEIYWSCDLCLSFWFKVFYSIDIDFDLILTTHKEGPLENHRFITIHEGWRNLFQVNGQTDGPTERRMYGCTQTLPYHRHVKSTLLQINLLHLYQVHYLHFKLWWSLIKSVFTQVTLFEIEGYHSTCRDVKICNFFRNKAIDNCMYFCVWAEFQI